MTLTSPILVKLINCANNCYINSCLQILSHTSELQEVLSRFPANSFEDSLLLKNWIELNTLMTHKSCSITPGKFLRTIYDEYGHLYEYGVQYDMCEFFIFMVDNIIESTLLPLAQSKKYHDFIGSDTNNIIHKVCNEFVNNILNHYSPVMNIFYNINVTLIIDENKGILLNTIPALENVINLPISITRNCSMNTITLDNCLEEYTSFENMNKKNNNAWYNDVTKQYIDVRKKTLFWSLPTILSIRLNRFTNNGMKNNTKVDIPFTLDMSPYMTASTGPLIYELYAICHHEGTLEGGHYFVYIKAIDENWYQINDNIIVKILNEKVMITNKIYCVFYRHKI